MYMYATAVAGVGLILIALVLILRWRHRYNKCAPPCDVLNLCPNPVQQYEVEEKDSLDDHLDVLARKLAAKEGRLRISKYKIRETQNEIENLQATDQDVRDKYRVLVESLRTDLMTNEKECRKLQEQIELVSRKRVELKDEAGIDD